MIEIQISKSKADKDGLVPYFECPDCGQGYLDTTPDGLVLEQMSVDCSCDNCNGTFHIFRRPTVHHTITPIR